MPPSPALPVRVPLATEPLGSWGSLQAGRRNVLELIPEIATHAPILSGRTGKRWHMVMDPGALKQILRDRVEDYPAFLPWCGGVEVRDTEVVIEMDLPLLLSVMKGPLEAAVKKEAGRLLAP